MTMTNAGRMRGALAQRVAAAVAALFLCLGATVMEAQRGRASAPAPQHSARPEAQRRQPEYRPQARPNTARPAQERQRESRPARSNEARPQAEQRMREPARPQSIPQNSFVPSNGFVPRSDSARPQYAPSRPEYPGGATVRPALPGNGVPGAVPPGHLGWWLNQHRNVPLQGQEQLLRRDPSFQRMAPADQQRLVQQLRQVDQMPAQQRERRLARAEAIERMSPQERAQLSRSTQELTSLPADRQSMVKQAFRDLRGVPGDQRQTVINSDRYQRQFSPQERDILTNLLRAEPYQPGR